MHFFRHLPRGTVVFHSEMYFHHFSAGVRVDHRPIAVRRAVHDVFVGVYRAILRMVENQETILSKPDVQRIA